MVYDILIQRKHHTLPDGATIDITRETVLADEEDQDIDFMDLLLGEPLGEEELI